MYYLQQISSKPLQELVSTSLTLARQKVLDFHATYSSWFNCSFISTFMQLNQRILFSYVTLLSNLVLHPRLISISSLLMNLSSQKLPWVLPWTLKTLINLLFLVIKKFDVCTEYQPWIFSIKYKLFICNSLSSNSWSSVRKTNFT